MPQTRPHNVLEIRHHMVALVQAVRTLVVHRPESPPQAAGTLAYH